MASANHEPNRLFHAARIRKGLSRQELADAVNKLLPPKSLLTAGEIGRIERGSVDWPRAPRRAALRNVLGVDRDADLGLANKRRRPTDVPSEPAVVDDDFRGPTEGQRLTVRQRRPGDEPAPPPENGRLSRRATYDGQIAMGQAGDRMEAHDVLRRTVLMTVATAAGSLIFGQGRNDAQASGSDVTFMAAGVDHWQEAVWEYGYAYHVTPRATLLSDLCDDLAIVKRELSTRLRADSVDAKPIAAATAQLVALAAMICTDLGFAREGRHLWRFARRYAELSGDQAIRLWINGHEITSGIYQQRPLPVLADLAERALSISTSAGPTAGKAELLGGQAQVLSLLRRTREAQIALNRLRDTYEQLPTSTTELRDSLFGWPEHRLRHAESFTCSMTGSTADAYRAQDNALNLYPLSRQIGRCQIELHRARCLIRDGSLDEGLQRAGSAVEHVAIPRRKEFVLAIADRVAEAVPLDRASRAKAAEFLELTRAARTTRAR